MNNEAAKWILQGYRPGGQDANDPRFREALEQMQRDPELARWFANEQTLDRHLSARMRAALRPPPHLKSQLLAQCKVTRPKAWWKMPVSQMAAACLALLATLGVLWLKPEKPQRFSDYLGAMANFAGHKLDRLDLMSRDVTEVRRWLAHRNGHGEFVVPAGLEGRPSLGCRVLEWNGHKVSLICFELENNRVAHLLVVDSAAFADAPAESPVFNEIGDMVTVSWGRAGKTYILASKAGNLADLLRLL